MRAMALTFLRLFEHQKDPAVVGELIRVLLETRPAVDEVWLATEYCFPPLSAHRRNARCMEEAAARFREAGFGVGLQISNTLGHVDVRSYRSDGISWQRMVGADGRTARACNCPRAPEFRDYLAAVVRMSCAWRPTSVWIDDDLRMQNHGMEVVYGCFCPECLAAFSRADGREWTREGLAAALNGPGDAAVRGAWIRFNQEGLADVARRIAEAVREVSPETRMAQQFGGTERCRYSGPDWKPMLRALHEVSGMPIGVRPGGGYYTDHQPREMLEKAFQISRQISELPEGVGTVCPEIESFFHTAMNKTPHGLAVESAVDLAVGCDSLSYAILMVANETPSAHAAALRRIGDWRPFYEGYVEGNRGARLSGLEAALGARHELRPIAEGEKPWAWTGTDLGPVYRMAAFGLPLCTARAGSVGAVLTSGAVDGCTDGELRELLAGGLLLDGAALARLGKRGLADAAGAGAEPMDAIDAVERLSGDPLNGRFAGRTFTQFAWDAPRPSIYRLTPKREARVLSGYVDAEGRPDGAAALALETALGGRLVVLGARGFGHLVSSARMAQILSAVDWATGGRLPVLVETPVPMAVFPRTEGRGSLRSVLLLNCTIDRSPPVSVRLRGIASGAALRWIRPCMEDVLLPMEILDGEVRTEIPPLEPWSVGYVSPVL